MSKYVTHDFDNNDVCRRCGFWWQYESRWTRRGEDKLYKLKFPSCDEYLLEKVLSE